MLYALTIFTSAFLLFQIQPVIAKFILPWFGGSASVWTTCMLFFQTVLVLGYLYSHWSIRRLSPKSQAAVHFSLLLGSVLLLPVTPSAAWKPVAAGDPALEILGLLSVTVGLPYFLLSTTGPLIQSWYAREFAGRVPYRLFALSNLASMLALLGYPVLVEPVIDTPHQLFYWSGGYALFVLLCGACAFRSAKIAGHAPAAAPATGEAPGFGRQIVWLLLAAVASTLLFGVTNHLSQNVAAIPFLWVLPLSCYLLSFILCFDGQRWYDRRLFHLLLLAALGGMCYQLLHQTPDTSHRLLIALFAAELFVCCMFCHGELARLKPEPRHLTGFYLMVAIGGALGAVLAGLVAPRVFSGYFEFPISIAACGLLALFLIYRKHWVTDIIWVAASVALLVFAVAEIQAFRAGNRVMVRNFYGGLRVVDSEGVRTLIHGTINHGAQYLAAERSREPLTYYGKQSGAGLVLASGSGPQRVGIIGLGAGALATYGRPGDTYRFYEINPLVVDIARREFTYLKASDAGIDVTLGDGRLSVEREPPGKFDVLVVDAFSGDSIPVHLLTREAFELYFSRMKPDGVLALHISNAAVDLSPVVRGLADALTADSLLIRNAGDERNQVIAANWFLVTRAVGRLEPFRAAGQLAAVRHDLRLWTDSYSNLFQILR